VILKPIDRAKPGKYGYSFKQQVIGQTIDDNRYDQHKKRARKTNDMQIREQRIDDKVLLYARNGFNATKTLTITLKMTNMAASRSRKLTIKIPPLTDLYLQHVKLIDSTKDANMGYSYGWE
jgi:hypothetical protein